MRVMFAVAEEVRGNTNSLFTGRERDRDREMEQDGGGERESECSVQNGSASFCCLWWIFFCRNQC